MPTIAIQPPLPGALQIEITSRCNLRCRMCPLDTSATLSSQAPGHMVETTLAEARAMALKVRRVIVAGFGEALLNPAFLPFLEDLDAQGVQTNFSSNGHAVTPAVVERLARLRHLDHVNVSIDSPDPATYRAIRGGKVEQALQGLRYLMALPRAPQIVTVSSVMMRANLAGLQAFPALLAGMGARRYVIQAYIDYIGAEHNQVSAVELKDGIERIRAACLEAGVELLHDFPDAVLTLLGQPSRAFVPPERLVGPARETKQCSLPWEIPILDKDGRVFPCCRAEAMAAGSVGSLAEASLEDIWHGPTFSAFRDGLASGEAVPPMCRSCDLVTTGVHPLRAYAAKLLPEQSLVEGGRVRVVVRNMGAAVWTQDNPVWIGTAAPYNRHSVCASGSWPALHRPATMREDKVGPGETATFEFTMRGIRGGKPELFQLVVDGVAWLPATTFALTPPQPSGAQRLIGALPPEVQRRGAAIRLTTGRFGRRLFPPSSA